MAFPELSKPFHFYNIYLKNTCWICEENMCVILSPNKTIDKNSHNPYMQRLYQIICIVFKLVLSIRGAELRSSGAPRREKLYRRDAAFCGEFGASKEIGSRAARRRRGERAFCGAKCGRAPSGGGRFGRKFAYAAAFVIFAISPTSINAAAVRILLHSALRRT